MTDEESPTESQPMESDPTQGAPVVALTEERPPSKPWWRRPGVVALIAGGFALITAIALVVVWVVIPDNATEAQEQVFLTPADQPGQDPFTETSFATPQDPAITNPGPDPAGAPPAQENQARTVYGDTDGLFGGTRNESTCDGQGLINYLQQQPAKAAAWVTVPKITVDQIPSYIQQLTPVRLRSDTRVLDHGYVNGQVYSRQAVLQAMTAVMVDKYGVPRVRCMSGSPLLEIPEVQQMQPQQAQPGQQTQPVQRAAAARPPVYIGTPWQGFNPRVVVVILRPLQNRIIDFIILLDLRRLPIIVLFARRLGIRLGITGVDLRVFDVDLVVARPPRAVVAPPPQAPPPQAPPPLQAAPPLQAPPPVQAPPASPPVLAQPPIQAPPPVQGQPPVVAAPPVLQAPPAPLPPIDSGFTPVDPGVLFPPIMPPIIRGPMPPVQQQPMSPPVDQAPMMPPVHQQPALVPQQPALVPQQPALVPEPASPQGPSGSMPGGHQGQIPQDEPGVVVPKIDGSNTNPEYPQLPQPPSSGSGPGSGSGSGSGSYTPPNYGSLPGAGDTGGSPGGNLRCDPVLNPC
ncbi:hypothetical protein Mycsm_04077 [Mycobacterium sp. JS623]|uniref:DUF6777 domain-containing protein n=1 Tax=Mycobacterium sp. JS623 TaxID=212767 RepID=UPI0002A57B65|nr:DUF6777 domain-containing protein [Mycobacterium sp. JS623]AGB24330.1 hypothetical protein Mycsm_04077 [Mycobacterium sp. JS623]